MLPNKKKQVYELNFTFAKYYQIRFRFQGAQSLILKKKVSNWNGFMFIINQGDKVQSAKFVQKTFNNNFVLFQSV